MLEALFSFISNLFGGGGAEGAAAGIGTADVLRDVAAPTAAGVGAESFYPAAATAAGSGSDLLQAGALGLQGAGLGAQLAQGGPQGQMPMSMMGTSAMQPGVDPQAVRSRLAQSQSQGLSGASPDFLANSLGLTLPELEAVMGWTTSSKGGAG